MDDDKKPYKLKNPLILLLYGLLLAAIVNRLLFDIQEWLAHASFSAKYWPYVLAILKILSTILSIFFATGIFYSNIRLTQLRTAENKRMKDAEMALSPVTASGQKRNLKWERVLQHINSDNPNDWRQAILEADIILDEIMEVMGYHGDTLGDKLKSVEKSDFTTIDFAWDAHKVRNQIAHEGSDFLITQREAKRVINLYRNVFHEFRYI